MGDLCSRVVNHNWVMKSISSCVSCLVACLLVWLMVPLAAHAQFLGNNLGGDAGLMAATQPDPGTYFVPLYVAYRGDTLRDRDGNVIAYDPERLGSLDVSAYGIGIWWVSEKKVLGGNYSLMVAPAWTNNKFEAPILGLIERVPTGFTDLYVQPINLGWHNERADYSAGIGIYAPTGRYHPDADDNLGLGMWTLELFAGGTWYLDQARSWSFSTLAAYEIHGEKKHTDIRVGDILTLEGGLGKSFMDGALSVGVAYYAQWKITNDDFGGELDLLPGLIGKNRGFGAGPEISLPLATKKNLWGFLSLRYLWEFGTRNSVEGNMFVATLSFPLGGIPLE